MTVLCSRGGNDVVNDLHRKLGWAMQGVACDMINQSTDSDAMDMAMALTDNPQLLTRAQVHTHTDTHTDTHTQTHTHSLPGECVSLLCPRCAVLLAGCLAAWRKLEQATSET